MSKKNKGLFGSNEELDVMDVDATVNEAPVDGAPVDVAVDSFKEKKKLAAKKHAEKVKAAKEAALEAAKEIKELPEFEKLSDKTKEYINSVINGRAQTSNGTGSNFEKAFGSNPKVGDTVTLLEVFQKTLKEKSSFDWYTRKWAEKGIIIEYKQNSEDVLKSTYTITALPNA